MNAYRWSDLFEGMSHQFDTLITTAKIERFAEISGDSNPLHTVPEFAKNAGFSGVVAFGLLTSSYYSRLVGMYLPGRFALLQGISAS